MQRNSQDKGVLSECLVNIVQLIDTPYISKLLQEELKYLVSNDQRVDYLGKLANKIKQSGNTLILVDLTSAGEKLPKHLYPTASL